MRLILSILCLNVLLLAPWPCIAPNPPKIYVYDLPEDLNAIARLLGGSDKEQGLTDRVRNGEHYTANPDVADFFWIPGQGPIFIEWVKNTYPYWNRTVAAKQARHVMVALYDGGPREIFTSVKTNPSGATSFSPEYDPSSRERNIIFLSWNGRRDVYPKSDHLDYKCGVCFQIGIDIQIPTMENVCGPLCSGITIHELRNSSLWNHNRSHGNGNDNELAKPRRHRMFFIGNSRPFKFDGSGRGTFFINHYNDSRYVVASRGHPHHHSDLYPHHITTSMVMPHSDFSYSPLGVNGGDTDRYVPAVLFGSVPVMMNSTVLSADQPHTGIPQALPLEEIIDWSQFSTLVDEHSLDGQLDSQLDCLSSRLPEMRRAMKGVWENLLWTSIYSGKFKSKKSTFPSEHNTRSSYLGESGDNDAFAILMKVLASRISHGYKPSPETMQRLEHNRWPCREVVENRAKTEISWRI